jgi:hypothetical protein
MKPKKPLTPDDYTSVARYQLRQLDPLWEYLVRVLVDMSRGGSPIVSTQLLLAAGEVDSARSLLGLLPTVIIHPDGTWTVMSELLKEKGLLCGEAARRKPRKPTKRAVRKRGR